PLRPTPAGRGPGRDGARPGQDHGDGGPHGGRVRAPGTATMTGGPGRLRTLQRFFALTAINPLTAVYFVVLTSGLGGTVHGTAAAAAFAAGVFAASLSWQLLLVGVGSLAGARLPEWARTATSLTGYVVILGYAVKLALG
ncbi:MAG TPA: LysE family transporter, partial [Kineosporiaceae bacterium]|nr:LysE family transporter [Kineosporiaceae bacterium]